MTRHLFRTPLVLVTALAPLLFFGCYTVVRHPQSMEVAARVDVSDQFSVDGTDHMRGSGACSDCHFESEWLGYFDHPLIYGFGGYATHERWYDYYDRPWWYDSYWDHDSGSGGTPGSPFPEGAASSWTRRPRVRGEAPPVVDQSVPPSTVTGSSGASSTTPAYTTPNTQPSSGAGNAKEDEPASSYDKKKRTPR